MQQDEPIFHMFSLPHIIALLIGFLFILILYIYRNKNKLTHTRRMEWIYSFTLLGMELGYHLLYVMLDKWRLYYTLPLELCSITLIAAILLLWTRHPVIFQFVFYAGIAGSLQALITPDLEYGYPHFRFFHYFYVHLGIIFTALYFVWWKRYKPTLMGTLQTMVILNVLLPMIMVINHMVDGNYMFLKRKPVNGSLLDYLGPYPWYIISMEAAALLMSLLLWLFFRKRHK